MKRSIVLGVIAVALMVLYAVYMNPALLPLSALLLIAAMLNEYYRRRRTTDTAKPYEQTVAELTAEYGEPDDVILVNATRANEALGVILVYADFLIVEGRRMAKADITDVTFNNSGTPYAPGEYQVVIATATDGCRRISVGYDAAWAGDVAELIRKNL